MRLQIEAARNRPKTFEAAHIELGVDSTHLQHAYLHWHAVQGPAAVSDHQH